MDIEQVEQEFWTVIEVAHRDTGYYEILKAMPDITCRVMNCLILKAEVEFLLKQGS